MLWAIPEQQGVGNEALVAKRVDLVIWRRDGRWSLVSCHGNRQLAPWSSHLVLHMDRVWEKMLFLVGGPLHLPLGWAGKGCWSCADYLRRDRPRLCVPTCKLLAGSWSFQGS